MSVQTSYEWYSSAVQQMEDYGAIGDVLLCQL